MPPRTKVVTFLEMTAPDEVRPATAVSELALEVVADPLAQAGTIRTLHDAIAGPHDWSSLRLSDEQWRQWLTDPDVVHFLVLVETQAIGWACLRNHRGGEVEIDAFGLVPASVGRGFGGAALTELLTRAWGLGGGGAPVRRVWLHTSSWDHPHALANYRARGFRTFRVQERVVPADAGGDERPG